MDRNPLFSTKNYSRSHLTSTIVTLLQLNYSVLSLWEWWCDYFTESVVVLGRTCRHDSQTTLRHSKTLTAWNLSSLWWLFQAYSLALLTLLPNTLIHHLSSMFNFLFWFNKFFLLFFFVPKYGCICAGHFFQSVIFFFWLSWNYLRIYMAFDWLFLFFCC